MMTGLSQGRIVRYVLSKTDLPESHRHLVGATIPAIVVNDWLSLGRDDGYSNLVGFTDGANMGLPLTVHLTSRVFSEDPKPGTWHWPNVVASAASSSVSMPALQSEGATSSDQAAE